MIRGFKVSTPRAPRAKASKAPAKQGADDDPEPHHALRGDTSTGPFDTSTGLIASPGRGPLLAALTEGMRAALEGGDDEAVKVAHGAIGRLLLGPGTAPPGKADARPRAAAPPDARDKRRGAAVVDLAHERGKRGRS